MTVSSRSFSLTCGKPSATEGEEAQKLNRCPAAGRIKILHHFIYSLKIYLSSLKFVIINFTIGQTRLQ